MVLSCVVRHREVHNIALCVGNMVCVGRAVSRYYWLQREP
jgi:hypothetical protein